MPPSLLSHAPRGAAGVVSAVMVAGLSLWGVGVPTAQVEATQVQATDDIQTTAPVAQVIDMSTSTVADILTRQPDTDRFYLLLLNTGELAQVSGTGPYTVYAPDNSAFDYLPRAQYVDLSLSQQQALAEAQLDTASLPAGVRVVKEYQAENGVVYLIDAVLSPQ